MFLGRVVKRGEPEWLDEDRSWALALTALEDDTCDGCGQSLSESTAMRGGRPVHSYDVDSPEICGGCTALARELPEWQDDPRRTALKFRVVKRT